MHLTIQIAAEESPGLELDSLKQDLLAADELRSAAIESRTGLPTGGMGPILETLLISFASGGVGVALVEGVFGWLRSRPAGITVKFSNGDRSVEVDDRTARDPAAVIALLQALDVIESGPRGK
ncbi:hypothetical protein ACFFHJ_31020 [Planotetraspora thailandica]|uniref:effector-associated constant component EACC1 n=1 Tax=Planotetraspora thailandica TaxID=487172 RepID=UPI001951E9E4|nr:hypothetical protein [Planotetraspora thailandica]